MATGLLGDVLSYIRLFALGLSGSILGLVFNDLAMNMKPDIPVVGTIVMLLILIFGHAMNIALSALSAFVHPMRLTFVEFYKNSGFVGGAKEYTPFKKN
jgi:V/A-type H+-transporting ATPase subunit I